MKRLAYILLLCIGISLAQTPEQNVAALRQRIQDFEYQDAIQLADSLTANPDDFTEQQLIEIYEMQGIAHYSRMRMNEAFGAFLQILQLDPSHTLDPVRTSPKIVAFFQGIKFNYNQAMPEAPESRIDTVTVVQTPQTASLPAVAASLLVPGSGHWLDGRTPRGPWLTAAGTLGLGAAIATTVDCMQKRDDYLSAVMPGDIDARYQSYNAAFKRRNVVLIAYSAFWLYTQIDLLKPQDAPGFTLQPSAHVDGMILGYQISF